ncbi:MAG: S1 family peptidase [Arcanobacterium sp.]|nr:S1 family peptidase [Arcanobacterium sp.]
MRKTRLFIVSTALITSSLALTGFSSHTLTKDFPVNYSQNIKYINIVSSTKPNLEVNDSSEVISQIVWENVIEELDAIPEVMGFYTDTETNTLYIDVNDPTLEIPSLETAFTELKNVQELEVEEQNTHSSLNIVLNYTGTASDTANVYGGTAMSRCTVGFTSTYNNQHGFWSARHCSHTDLSYYPNLTGAGSPIGKAKLIATSNNRKADIGFYTIETKNTVLPSFYGESSRKLTAASGVTTVAKGSKVCRRGKTTGYNCGTVVSTNYTPTWPNACITGSCYPNFVLVLAPTDGGDSGGPWFSGNSAVGIHKGGSSKISVYSKLSYAPGSLNKQ